ncbi:MAG: helix-turn-helix domain-containing protein [Pseudomonadota bacterium]
MAHSSVPVMLDPIDVTEIILRGAAMGVNLLVAGLIMISRAPTLRRWLAVIFITATSAYILQSAPDIIPLGGMLDRVTKAMAILNTVFFWWFARSLFEDDFRWTWLKVAPFIALTVMHAPLAFGDLADVSRIEMVVHSALSITLLGHAVWIALNNRDDDLVDPRRRFRLAFAVVVGVAGIVIAIGENIHMAVGLPRWVTLVHAIGLSVLTYFFAFWMLHANRALFGPVAGAPETQAVRAASEPQGQLSPTDRLAFDKLAALMESGVYREEALSVAKLADKVGVPEHQLRRLINRELGFRNFSAFLNARRVEDAKLQLADPSMAKKQVLQIALDLGYGSIAPFNRAFKSATGQTPTEFRKEKLGAG